MIPTNLSRSHTSKSGYPMDCDPAPLSTPNATNASSRYMMRCNSGGGASSNGSGSGGLSQHQHNHRNNHYSNLAIPNYPLSSNSGIIGIGSAGIGMGGAHSNNSSSNSSRTSSNYHAPNSLPIDLGLGQSMFGIGSGMDGSESSYQRHLLSGGSSINLPQQLSAASNKSGSASMTQTSMRSNGGGAGGSGSSGGGGGGGSSGNGSGANDRDDDSRMVGVCVQQSPVAIH